MLSKAKHIVLIFLLIVLSYEANSQMIFDTLDLKLFEIKSNFIERNSTTKSQSIDTLIKKELDHLNLGELLMAESPIFIKSYGKGSLATASFRGTAASHTKVLWNDFEINSPMLGQVDLSLVPNAFFDKAQLEYGGSSIESTSGALGGAINLYSGIRKSQNAIEFTQSIGSFKTFTSSMKANFKIKKLASSTSVYLNSSDNSFSYYNDAIIPAEWQKQEKASYYNRGFVQELDYIISETQSIKLKSWNQWNFREIPLIMSNQQVGNNKEEQGNFSSRNIIDYTYKKPKTVVDVKTAWFLDDMNYLLKTTTAVNYDDTVTFINSTNKSNSGFFKIKIKQDLNNSFMVSAEVYASKSNVNSNNYSDIKSRENYGVFVKLNKKFSDFAVIDLFLRQEYSDDKFLPIIPFIGLSLKPIKTEEFYIRLSANKNYNLPSLNDLFWFPGGNVNLLPEEGLQYDAGINYSKTFSKRVKLLLNVNLYNSQISNWIQWVPSDYRYWTARNIESARARGLESSFSLSGSTADIFYKFSIQYSFNKSTNESAKAKSQGYSGRQLIYVPLHSGNFFFYFKYKQNSFNWNTLINDRRNTTLDDESPYSNTLAPYSLSNISLGREIIFKKFNIDLRIKVNNIFDTSYQAILWRAMPGRSFEAFVSINIK